MKDNSLDKTILRFIDAYLLVHEQINTKVITTTFDVKRCKASRLFKIYRDDRPSNMRYEPSLKLYKKGFVFTPTHLGLIPAQTYLDSINISFGHTKK